MGQIATEVNEGDAERGSLSWPFSLSPCTRARSPSIPPSFHFSVANRERLRLPPLPCRLRSLARIPTHAGRTVAVVGLLLDGVERVRVLLRPPLRSRRRAAAMSIVRCCPREGASESAPSNRAEPP